MKKILSYLDIVLLFVVLMMCEVLLRHFSALPLFTLQAFLFDVSLFLIIAMILSLFRYSIRKDIEVILTILVAIYCFAQSFHFAYFKTFFSFRKLSVGGELLNVFEEIFEKWNPWFLLFLVPIFLMSIYHERKEEKKRSVKSKVIVCVLMTLISLGSFGIHIHAIQKDYESDYSWKKDYYLYQVMQNKNRFLERFGVFEYIIKDIELTLKPTKVLSEEEKREVKEFIDRSQSHKTNEMTGFFKDKNLIVILCESFDESAILEDLTPTLYQLSKESFYFNNHYAPIFEVATGDSEFISQTGMLPSLDYGTTAYTFHLNHYPNALANLFERKGYNANSYHSYISNFYNREVMHESFGFQTFYDMDKLKLERFEGFNDTVNWVEDEKLMEGVLKYTKTGEPFYDFIITSAGHLPYKRSARKELEPNLAIIEQNPRYKDLDEETKCYYAAQMLLDQGMKKLMDGLKEKGVLEDTVILMFADHYPYGIEGEGAMREVLKNEEEYAIYKVPMMLYHSGTKGKKINTLTSTFDIYPTIANLFELDIDDYYTVGKDAFSREGDRFVPFANRSFLTDFFYFDTGSNTLEDFGKMNEDAVSLMVSKIEEKMADIFRYGQDILVSDYYEK